MIANLPRFSSSFNKLKDMAIISSAMRAFPSDPECAELLWRQLHSYFRGVGLENRLN